MGNATIMFRSGQSIQCSRDGGDDQEAADALLNEVQTKKGEKPNKAFVHCDNGGGFDANEVVAVTAGGSKHPGEEFEESEF